MLMLLCLGVPLAAASKAGHDGSYELHEMHEEIRRIEADIENWNHPGMDPEDVEMVQDIRKVSRKLEENELGSEDIAAVFDEGDRIFDELQRATSKDRNGRHSDPALRRIAGRLLKGASWEDVLPDMLDVVHNNSTRRLGNRRLEGEAMLTKVKRIGQVMGFSFGAIATVFTGFVAVTAVSSTTTTAFDTSHSIVEKAKKIPKIGAAFNALGTVSKPLVSKLEKAQEKLEGFVDKMRDFMFALVKAVKGIATGAPVVVLLGMAIPAIGNNSKVKSVNDKIVALGNVIWNKVKAIKNVYTKVAKIFDPFIKQKKVFATINKIYTYKVSIPKDFSVPNCKSGYKTANFGAFKKCGKCNSGYTSYDGLIPTARCWQFNKKRKRTDDGKSCCYRIATCEKKTFLGKIKYPCAKCKVKDGYVTAGLCYEIKWPLMKSHKVYSSNKYTSWPKASYVKLSLEDAANAWNKIFKKFEDAVKSVPGLGDVIKLAQKVLDKAVELIMTPITKVLKPLLDKLGVPNMPTLPSLGFLDDIVAPVKNMVTKITNSLNLDKFTKAMPELDHIRDELDVIKDLAFGECMSLTTSKMKDILVDPETYMKNCMSDANVFESVQTAVETFGKEFDTDAMKDALNLNSLLNALGISKRRRALSDWNFCISLKIVNKHIGLPGFKQAISAATLPNYMFTSFESGLAFCWGDAHTFSVRLLITFGGPGITNSMARGAMKQWSADIFFSQNEITLGNFGHAVEMAYEPGIGMSNTGNGYGFRDVAVYWERGPNFVNNENPAPFTPIGVGFSFMSHAVEIDHPYYRRPIKDAQKCTWKGRTGEWLTSAMIAAFAFQKNIDDSIVTGRRRLQSFLDTRFYGSKSKRRAGKKERRRRGKRARRREDAEVEAAFTLTAASEDSADDPVPAWVENGHFSANLALTVLGILRPKVRVSCFHIHKKWDTRRRSIAKCPIGTYGFHPFSSPSGLAYYDPDGDATQLVGGACNYGFCPNKLKKTGFYCEKNGICDGSASRSISHSSLEGGRGTLPAAIDKYESLSNGFKRTQLKQLIDLQLKKFESCEIMWKNPKKLSFSFWNFKQFSIGYVLNKAAGHAGDSHLIYGGSEFMCMLAKSVLGGSCDTDSE